LQEDLIGGRGVVEKERLVKLKHNIFVHFLKMHFHLVAQQLVFSETSTHSSLKLLNYLLNSSILYILGGEKLVEEFSISEFADEVIYVAYFEPMFCFEIALDSINRNFFKFFE
jgi:hypothetical protein